MSYVERFCTRKWLTSHIEREHQPNESKPEIDDVNKKISLPEKQKQDNNPSVSTYQTHRNVNIGPSNVGKIY